ncbi:MAG: SAM-dependent methyltransferase [Chlorobi bacterium]|nr:SAM-dependent methyltransferase [Chlorobiota bacterium]
MEKFSPEFWDMQYKEGKTGWDIGYVSPPLKEYIDQLTDRSLKILVPGAGSAWEVEYLFNNHFKNTFLLDFSEESILRFRKRCPVFPEDHIIKENFFEHSGQYDRILEQTFITSFPTQHRQAFARQVSHLLKPGGKFVGLMFNHEFPFDGPPFGGTKQEYQMLFEDLFEIEKLEIAYNSIKPRKGRELFVVLRKKSG